MKDREPDAKAIDVAALCRDARRVEGRLALSALPRLAASVLADADGAAAAHWWAQGRQRVVHGGPPELWLDLHAALPVHLECQRCLQPLALDLAVDRRLRFVRGEHEAERLDEELEEDVLALEPRTDLAALIEDELILALPLVPRHDPCPEPLPQPADESAAEPAPHPFAALERLRGGGS